MTDKTISDLVSAGAITAAALAEIERNGYSSRKISMADLLTYMQNKLVGREEGIKGIIGASGTYLGGTLYPVTPALVVKAGQKIIVEAELYRLTGGSTGIYLSPDGTNYYSVADQGDGNHVNYYQGGLVGIATGANTNRNYTGIHRVAMEINVFGPNANYIATKVDEQRLPSSGFTSQNTNNMVGTISCYLSTGDASKSSVRLKVIG